MAKKQELDKRRCHRIKIALAADLKEVEESKYSTMGEILDFSGIGMRIVSNTIFDTKQKLYVQLEVSEGKKITIETEVMWMKRVMQYDSYVNEYGLKISESMSHDERKYLKFFVKKFFSAFKSKK